MSMTIGRASISADPYVGTLTASGDTVSFVSDLGATSLTACQAIAQQLRGLVANRDEDAIPFTWSLDSTFDGFYMVRSVSVEPESTFIQNGRTRFSIVMERVAGGYARPQFESTVQTLVRTNAHGVTAPAGYVLSWYGGTSTESDATASGIWNFAISEGTQKWLTGFAPQSVATYRVSTVPADYYKNSARIEVQYGGTWYPVHGDQLPLGTGVNWRINNGFVRMYPTSVGGNGRFTVESWRAADGWVGVEMYIQRAVATAVNATGTTGDPSSVRVIRNSPECVTLRVRQQAETASTFDFSLRRGDFWFELSVTQPPGSAVSNSWGLAVSTAVGATAFTGGINATTAVSNRKWLFSCPVAITTDLANGRLVTTAAAATAQFQFTPDFDIGLAVANTTARDLFLSARSERVRVVSR